MPLGFREEVLAAFKNMLQWCRPVERDGLKNHQRSLRLRRSMWIDDQSRCAVRCDCEALFKQPEFHDFAESIYVQNAGVRETARPTLRLATFNGVRVQA